MGNQIAVKLHTRPGTEVVIEERGHIYNYEMAAMSAVSGALARPVKSGDGSGMLRWEEIEVGHPRDAAYYVAPTALVAIENSHNLAGGSVYTGARTAEICERAHALSPPRPPRRRAHLQRGGRAPASRSPRSPPRATP